MLALKIKWIRLRRFVYITYSRTVSSHVKFSSVFLSARMAVGFQQNWLRLGYQTSVLRSKERAKPGTTRMVAWFGRLRVTEKWCDIKLASSWYDGMMLLL